MTTVAVGCELAGYRIDALIGRGGMGVVYRGTELRLNRPVAIKLIAAERASDPLVRHRFEREARLMAAIDHPNVLPVYAAGEEDGCLFMVMRYVAGTDLAALLRSHGRLACGRAARITEQVAHALDAAHRAGMVHRDVKPANVLLAGEHVYLSDFGIGRALEAATRLTESNEWLGTVDFCSPEQLRGDDTDGRSDVYALGCLLHTLLTGTPPLHRDTAAATMLAHLGEQPPAPSTAGGVPAAFDPIVAHALAKRPGDRYSTAGELGRAACVAAAGAATRPRSGETKTAPRVVPPARRDAFPKKGKRDAPAATRLDLRPRPEARDAERAAPPRTRRALLTLTIAALLVAGAAVAAVALGTRSRPPGPLTRSEISGVVRAFATAYGNRDAQGLGNLLAPDVTRVTPEAVERGRAAVLAEYEAQLSDPSISAYRVKGLRVQTGWVGRASGAYTVIKGSSASLTGAVAFGIERIDGRLEIGLITTQSEG